MFSAGRGLLVAAMAGFAFSAHADLTQEDSPLGLNTVIVDSVSGLSWLSLSLTVGQSWDSVNSQLATTFSGYRIASLDDVSQFAINAGVIPVDQSNVGINPALLAFNRTWGITNQFGTYSNAIFAQTSSINTNFPDAHARAVFGQWYAADGWQQDQWIAVTTTNNLVSTSEQCLYCGVALVSSVPEPETYAMLLAGLGLIGCIPRRRKQDVVTA